MSVAARGLSANVWRRIAAALCHVPGVEADVTFETGAMARIADDTAENELSINDLRTVVVETLGHGAGETLPIRFADPSGAPASVERVVLRGRSTQAFERGRRWRHTCTCRVTEHVLTELGVEESLALGQSALADVVTSPLRFLWARRDAGLDVTVLAFDWPPDPSESGEESIDQALRDLSVMCRIRASVDEL